MNPVILNCRAGDIDDFAPCHQGHFSGHSTGVGNAATGFGK